MTSSDLLPRRCERCDTTYHGPTEFRPGTECPRIIQLTRTAEGGFYRSAAREIAPGQLNRVMSVLGVRLFYGVDERSHLVTEYVMTGRAFASAEKRARAITPILFDTIFSSSDYEIDGERSVVERRVDLTPIATTATAIRVGRALGWTSRHSHFGRLDESLPGDDCEDCR